MQSTLFCPRCEEDRTFRRDQRDEEREIRGETIVLTVPLWVCSVCGETIVDDEFGDPIEKANDAYREKHQLLQPANIQAIRSKWGLSQAGFAALLGMSQATINRYEGGAIQQEKEDELIRMCESPEHMAGLLARRGHVLTERQRRIIEMALEGSPVERLSAIWDGFFESMPVEMTARSGFRRFDFDRFAAVVVWLCEKIPVVTQTKLYKLLFYADFLCFRSTSRSLTGALYKQMPYGPVPVPTNRCAPDSKPMILSRSANGCTRTAALARSSYLARGHRVWKWTSMLTSVTYSSSSGSSWGASRHQRSVSSRTARPHGARHLLKQ